MPLGPGEVFAGYTVERLLRSDYGGVQYLAKHPRVPRNELLWVFPAEWTADHELAQRFAREAELAAGLDHPNIVAVRDLGEYDGQPWIAFDRVAGADATALLDQHPAGVPAERVMSLVSAIAKALDHAHDHGVVHGGVAPARILTTDGDDRTRRILLADFALSRLAGDDASQGRVSAESVYHSAPELLNDEQYDGRADQYALAATAFHLLTGTPPFAHARPAVVISRHLTAPPPSLSGVRSDLARFDAAVARALAKDPEDRYPTCAEFAAAFAQHPIAPTAATTPPDSSSVPTTAPQSDQPAPPVIQSTWGTTPSTSKPVVSPPRITPSQPPAPAPLRRTAPAPPTTTPTPNPPGKPSPNTTAMRPGHRVTVIDRNHARHGQTGVIVEVLDHGFITVRFAGFLQALWEHPFRPHQIEPA
jgi:serine/threonine-protein kinase